MDIINNDHKAKDIYKRRREREKNAAYDEMQRIKPSKEAIEAFRRPAYYKNRKVK